MKRQLIDEDAGVGIHQLVALRIAGRNILMLRAVDGDLRSEILQIILQEILTGDFLSVVNWGMTTVAKSPTTTTKMMISRSVNARCECG
jgi:hypothetical protein